MLRGLRMVPVLLLLGAGGGVVVADTAPMSVVTAVRKAKVQCHGVDREAVRGDQPTYTRKQLTDFRNHKRVCGGIWLPEPRRYLVPQGLAVLGRTAWVSGFRYRKGYGQRPCQLVRVSLVTGKRVQFHAAIYGRVGNRPRTYCRHGGGIMQRGSYLWIVEKNKLWQVDPSVKKRVLTARRVWRIASPARGSAIVATPKRIGLVPFRTSGRAYIHWFSFRQLKKPGVLDLGARSNGKAQLGAVARTRVPTFVQGATLDARGRLYLTRSTLACGELVVPGGRRLGFVPGAEGIQFSPRGKRLYAISESGARPYVRSRKPLTPAVSAFEWPGLLSGRKPDCGFARY
jgi:hypothetical protein